MADGLKALSVVVFDGGYERVHYALVMASAAAATNRPATLFFTGPALVALTPGGWRRLGGRPEARDAELAARGVATFEPLLEACRDLGVRFIACEMGLRAEGLAPADLDPRLGVEVAGVVTLLNDARADGALLFI
ncbi:MAG TPA: DsrE/DsrF/DrsH-like family protein [Alphaproteobacteria bacterium]|nr:DsrE/DsrF/DrsH-like family protein [Alphaproteobacteria bacterium]